MNRLNNINLTDQEMVWLLNKADDIKLEWSNNPSVALSKISNCLISLNIPDIIINNYYNQEWESPLEW